MSLILQLHIWLRIWVLTLFYHTIIIYYNLCQLCWLSLWNAWLLIRHSISVWVILERLDNRIITLISQYSMLIYILFIILQTQVGILLLCTFFVFCPSSWIYILFMWCRMPHNSWWGAEKHKSLCEPVSFWAIYQFFTCDWMKKQFLTSV